jgi:thiol-disulfide isomerase/thioredoxin
VRRGLVLLALLVALAGCAADQDAGLVPGPPDVDVDTAELRQAKERIGMADCEPGPGSEPVEGGLPELVLPCLGGGPDVDLSSLRGPMVINLWGSYCGPCIEEMPAIEAFHQRYGDRVAVLGLDSEDVRPDAAMALAEETGATYPSLADPGGEFVGVEGFGPLNALPAWVFVDADGAVAHVEAVPVKSVAEIEAMVTEHLGVRL